MVIINFFKHLKNPKKLFLPLGKRQFFNWMSDEMYLKIAYFCEMDKTLNLENPKYYSEKIQWVKLNDRKKEYETYVDKYKVRSFVEEVIGKKYLIPLIGVYDNLNEIDWEALPQRFVIKCTHSSHTNIICTDKSGLDIKKSKRLLKRWLKTNLFWYGREWAYKNVKPRLICESFISDNGITPDDYKILCFNGVARMIEVHADRYGDHRLNYFDRDWNFKDFGVTLKPSDILPSKPSQLEEMIRLSEQLARNTYISRIDWYIVNDKLYFGEITLYEASGFQKKEVDDINRYMGDFCQLPTDL